MNPLKPERVQYIKLGPGGIWASEAISEGRVLFGAQMIDHNACLTADWESVEQQFRASGFSQQGVINGVRQLRSFYSSAETLWFTVATGKIWWAMTTGSPEDTGIQHPQKPSKYLQTVNGWHSESLDGQTLYTCNVSSALTKTASYRRTICDVSASGYLLRLINGEPDEQVQRGLTLLSQQIQLAQNLIKKLHWADFETLVDLIFTHSGWLRQGGVGGQTPDVDLTMKEPITGKTAWIQIKSTASPSTLKDYLLRFESDGSCTDFFFVCHSMPAPKDFPQESNYHFWGVDEIASRATRAGLFEWLLKFV